MDAPKSNAGSNDDRDERTIDGAGSVPAGRSLNFIEQIIEDDLRSQ